jgi:DNA-binding response OmpR family regulator
MNPHVLIVEDEVPIREGIVDLLGFHGFEVEAVGDGSSAIASIDRASFDLVVLDLMIPPPTGLEVLSYLRSKGITTPVLVLTAKGSEADIVEGIERGADDYVTKPFGVKELVARIKGLLRRAGSAAREQDNNPKVTVGHAILDTANARIEYDRGNVLALTARESILLGFLYTHRERIVSRAELLVHVWGYRDGSIETRTVDVHVQKLRAKLKVIPGGEQWIETVRGLGYRLGVK